VEASCANGVWVHNGAVQARGPVREVLGEYRAAVEGQAAGSKLNVTGRLGVRDAQARTRDGELPKTGGPIDVELTLHSDESHRAWIYLGITEGAATPIFLLNPGREVHLSPGSTRIRCGIPALPLPRGRYYVWGGVFANWTNGEELIGWQPITHFDVYGPDMDAAPRGIVRLSPVHVASNWEIEEPSS